MAFAFVACGYARETAIVPFPMYLPDAYTAAPLLPQLFYPRLLIKQAIPF